MIISKKMSAAPYRYHQPTRDYVDRKTKEGKGKMEIIRCLKRFIAREAYRALISIRTGATPIGEPPAERGRRLRELRVTHGITQQQVSDALGVHSSRISEIDAAPATCPNSNDAPHSGSKPSPPRTNQTNTPKPLTMYRSIETQWMLAELDSRERSKRARLLKQAGFPNRNR